MIAWLGTGLLGANFVRALRRRGHEVRVWNRTAERARRLCAELGGTPVPVAEPADVLVHCTSSGLDPSAPMFEGLPLRPEQLSGFGCVIDLVYREHETPLVRAARERSVPAVDGLDLLVGQGALSFERFTGRPAPVAAMRAAVGRAP